LICRLAIQLKATIFGEAESDLSMTALRAAAEGGRLAIIDRSAPLARPRRHELNDSSRPPSGFVTLRSSSNFYG
jgi:hypothetical protein